MSGPQQIAINQLIRAATTLGERLALSPVMH